MAVCPAGTVAGTKRHLAERVSTALTGPAHSMCAPPTLHDMCAAVCRMFMKHGSACYTYMQVLHAVHRIHPKRAADSHCLL